MKSAMILAAGLGQRMRPLTETLPKPLIPVAGKSMLERAFEHLERAHISHIVVNTHYLASLMIERIREISPSTLISHEEILLETGGGIKKALPLLMQRKSDEDHQSRASKGDSFFVLNGDSIWSGSKSITSMESKWDEARMDALLLLVPREKAYGYAGRGDFYMDFQGQLSRPEKDCPAPYVYIGVQLLSPQLFQNSPQGAFSMNLLWDEVRVKGRLYGHLHEGEWFHISTPQDLEKYAPIIASIQV